jgi:hypothetical protein
MKDTHQKLVQDLDAAIAAAIAANDELREYERVSVGAPALTFTAVPSIVQLTRWRTHVDAIVKGERTASQS